MYDVSLDTRKDDDGVEGSSPPLATSTPGNWLTKTYNLWSNFAFIYFIFYCMVHNCYGLLIVNYTKFLSFKNQSDRTNPPAALLSSTLAPLPFNPVINTRPNSNSSSQQPTTQSSGIKYRVFYYYVCGKLVASLSVLNL